MSTQNRNITNNNNDEQAQFEKDRASQGLDDASLDFRKILHQPVIIGFFSGILLSQIQSLFGEAHHIQLAITSLAVTLVVMVVARFYLDWFAIASWRLSARWMRIWMQFLNFFIFTSVLLTTTFFVHALSASISTSLFNWHESLSFVYISILLIFYFGDLQTQIAKS